MAPQSSERDVTLPVDVDLHARPAADVVRTALGFSSRIEICTADRVADAKSLLAVLALGAKAGSPLRLRAEGEDAPIALDTLAGCLAGLVE